MATLLQLPEKHGGEIGGDLAAGRRDSIRVWLRLLSCAMTIEKRVKRGFADRFDTTLPRFDVLAALDRAPDGLTMGQLSRKLLVSNGNVTALVQTLVRDGHVRMAPSPHDRRASIVTITEAGREHFEALAAAHHDWVASMLSGLTRSQRDELYELLGHLKASIAANDPEERP